MRQDDYLSGAYLGISEEVLQKSVPKTMLVLGYSMTIPVSKVSSANGSGLAGGVLQQSGGTCAGVDAQLDASCL